MSFAANARWARRLSIFLLSASVVLQGSLLVYCTVHHVRYSYMMGHYPAPWGNELTAGILEPFLAMLFAGVMLLCVLGGMGRILRDHCYRSGHKTFEIEFPVVKYGDSESPTKQEVRFP